MRDRDGDGKADERVDLITGLGPAPPAFDGLNDYVASGIRLGMDGFLYIAVGHKGIPRGAGKDGRTIQLRGGGVSGSGPTAPTSKSSPPASAIRALVALSATGEIFTYGTGDDSKKWPSSLTHHVVGGHFGFPYQFLTAPHRALPIMAGYKGGAGAQGICYNEDGLPQEYRGNLFLCDWGDQTVSRFEIRKTGATHTVERRSTLVSRGSCPDFRPYALAASADGASLYLADWAFDGWLASGPRTGRLYRLSLTDSKLPAPTPRPAGRDSAERIKALDHPALSVRLESQRLLSQAGPAIVPPLIERLNHTRTGNRPASCLSGRSTRSAVAKPEKRSPPRSKTPPPASASRRLGRREFAVIPRPPHL